MVEIDGSMGEGGGQIVRTTLSLSLVTQTPIRLTHIRAGRSQPGLRPQHVAAVRAAAEIGDAEVSTIEQGARRLTFEPSGITPGRHLFDVGTAGSAVLVLQTVLLPLLTAHRSTRVTVTGGTHNRYAPPFDFLSRTVVPLLERMGPAVSASIERPGFYPKGGGRCTIDIQPTSSLSELRLTERGALQSVHLRAIVANLPRHIAEREIATVRDALSLNVDETRIETPASLSAGNALLLELHFENVTTVVSSIGKKGVPAEEVALNLVEEAHTYVTADAPVGPYLADQLLLPLALAGGTIRTTTLTPHTHTNAAVIERVIGDRFSITEENGWRVSASPLV